MQESRILLTGGTGFLGSALLRHPLFRSAITVGRARPSFTENFVKMEMNEKTDFSEVLDEIDVIVHVAARAHIMDEKARNPIDEYRKTNVAMALNLARQAAAHGVKRFIFISSIKVLGNQTELGRPFTGLDAYNPEDPYGISKMEAEIGIQSISRESGMEFVIIRPPLIYGHGVKGNFEKLVKLVSSPVPLPFGLIHNKRSLIGVANLVDFICICLDHVKAKNQIFLVSDDHDLSTSELLTKIAEAGNKKRRIYDASPNFLKIIFILFGKESMYSRLCGSLQVDISDAKSMLGWKPPFPPEYSIRDSVAIRRKQSFNQGG